MTASSIVWKSQREITTSSSAPIVVHGHLEKVSILEDWRDRFKINPLPEPQKKHLQGGREVDYFLENESFSMENKKKKLPPPPMTLEELEALPTRHRPVIELVRQISSEGTNFALLASNKVSDSEDNISRELPLLEDDFLGEEDDQSVATDGGAPLAQDPNTNKKPQEQPNICTSTYLEDGDLHLTSLAVQQPPESRPGSIDGNGSPITLAHKSSFDASKSSNKIETSGGKGKVEEDLSDGLRSEPMVRGQKRGRCNVQHSPDAKNSATVESLEMPVQKKKRGRPKKHQPSPLDQDSTAQNADDSPNDKPAVDPDANNGSSTRKKRKKDGVEDETSTPVSKRQRPTN